VGGWVRGGRDLCSALGSLGASGRLTNTCSAAAGCYVRAAPGVARAGAPGVVLTPCLTLGHLQQARVREVVCM
jgi:hypothetical protein